MPKLSPSSRPQRRWVLLSILAIVAVVIPGTVLATNKPADVAHVQILNVSDWHGNLDPASANGGAWNISARWDADEAGFDGATLRLTAGDDFGATPPLSGFFEEVPAVQAERLMGISVNTFGNHDFDRGIAHLQSMIDLARAPSTGAGGDHPGEPFRYVASNLTNLHQNLKGVLPIKYLNLDGAKVAIIGIVNEEAPTLVNPGNFGTMAVSDGVAAANKYAREARWNGADAVVVITHKGVNGLTPAPFGPIVDFASALKPGLVDVVIGDHTNIQASGFAPNGVLWHENLSFGNSYAKTFLTIQDRNWWNPGYVLAKWLSFVTPGPAGSLSTDKTSCTGTGATATFCDQDIVSMLVPYRAQLAAQLDGVIGTTVTPFDRGGNIERRKEMPLGDLLADGLRGVYGVDIGYYTGGSIRTQFPACQYAPVNTALHRSNWDAAHAAIVACAGYAAGGPYDLTNGDIYSVLPFGNNIVTRTVTGTQLWKVLENGVSLCPNPIVSTSTCQGRFPQVSGIKFTFDVSKVSGCTGNEDPSKGAVTWSCAAGGRVTSVTKSDGTPIAADGTVYTFATTDFTNNGGDSYFMLADGQGTSRDRDANAFLTYLQSLSGPLDPSSYALDRITCLPVASCTP